MNKPMQDAADTIHNALVACLPNEQAAAMIGAKPAMLAETYRKLIPELKARAFTITGIENANTLQRIRDRIADLPRGTDWNTIKRDILKDISPYFETPDAEPEILEKQKAAAARRAETLIRHHGFQAYQAGMYDIMDRQRDALPFWQYVTVGDEKVRDTHRALDGIILPADSPFWRDHYPPWDWGCRCQVVPVDAETAGRIAAGELEGRALTPRQQQELEQTGRLANPETGQVINVAARQDEGAIHWNPAQLQLPLQDLHDAYDPDIWQRFASDMRTANVTLAQGERVTAWDWLLAPDRDKARASILAAAKGGREMAVALDWDTGRKLAEKTGTASSVSAKDLIEQARKEGRRIIIEHSHPTGGLDLPSPRDLATLVANPDVIEKIGVHAPLIRHTISTEQISETSRANLIKRLTIESNAAKNGEISAKEWKLRLKGYTTRGVFRYEQKITR